MLEIGKKLRSLRLEKGMTQADACGDESELSIRQLARIEKGQTMITLPKLAYLSDIYEVSIQELVDTDKMSLPKEYLVLKNKLIRSHTYGDPERIRKHEKMFDEIYEKYYENLPEEEQVLIEAVQILLDVYSSHDSNYALGLLDEYFHQVLKKQGYSLNDLLIINIYFFCCAVGLEDTQYFEELSDKVLLNIDYSDPEKLFLFELTLLAILTNVAPEKYLIYTTILREIIEETHSFVHKPVVYYVEAKYYLEVEEDRDKASDFYDKAITFASMIGDEVLVSKLEDERKQDLATYQ